MTAVAKSALAVHFNHPLYDHPYLLRCRIGACLHNPWRWKLEEAEWHYRDAKNEETRAE
jgi:hypothetical protein